MSAAESGFVVLGALSVAAWTFLVFAHGRFWTADQRLDGRAPAPEHWPAVAAVVPARNEAQLIERTLASLLAQDYPGPFTVVLVDDESEDGTGERAESIAKRAGGPHACRVLRTRERPAGWVGKMWAVASGVAFARTLEEEPAWLLLTDADVAHGADSLRRLVAKATQGKLDLVSLMVRLDSGRGLTRLLVPAFVYFFQKLYPFPRVNDPRSRIAAAAGGCVLVRSGALARAGGIEAIRSEVIDDCALGRLIKGGGPIWLGLADGERSIRPTTGVGDVWRMVARSAYTQLGYSPLALAGTLLGLGLLYALPPLAVLCWPIHGSATVGLLGLAGWLVMAASFLPTLTLYGESPAWSFALPLAGVLYAGMTLDSARRHWRGEGASWKGRAGAGRG